MMDLEKLKEPFVANELEWRVQQSWIKDGRPGAIIVPFVDARAIMNRLDMVAGPENWATKYEHVPGGVMCALSIKCGNEWVTKTDGAEVPAAEDTTRKDHIDPVKSSLTNAFKRAAVQWGIARELYGMDTAFAVIGDHGKYSMKIQGNTYRWNPPGEKSESGKPPTRPAATAQPERATGNAQPPAGAENKNQRKEIWDMLLDLNGGDMREAGAELGRMTKEIGGKEERFFNKIDQAIVAELHGKVRERHERDVR